MKTLLTAIFLIVISSCNQFQTQNKEPARKSIDRAFKVGIEILGAPGGVRFSAYLYPNRNVGDSIVFKKCEGKYCITKMLPITKLEREALFQQYDSIQTSFSMYDKNIIVNDGPIVYISIASNSNETNYIFRNLGLAEEANPHVAALIKLINSRLSEDNQMY